MLYLVILLFVFLCVIFFWEMRHSLKRSAESDRLIRQYEQDLDNKQLIQDIYAYCTKDWKLRRIMKKHAVSPADIDVIYHKLLRWGNFKKGRRFVPISSFFYVYTLNYLVTHKTEKAKVLTMRCMNFFHI